MYSYKTINGSGYVIHDATGCSLPYHCKTVRYTEMDIPEWKSEYFYKWINHYSRAMRENVKKMSIDTAITSIPATYITSYYNTGYTYPTISFAPLTTTVAVPADVCCKKQEGNNPMRNYNDTYACASVTTPKTDASTQRDYLLSRLQSAEYPKREELTKVYNLYVNNAPKTYKELIDAIKNDKFTLDAKRIARIDAREEMDEDGIFYSGYDSFDGIIWDGPQPDPKGYSTATKEMQKQYTASKDAIMTGDAAAGLAALQAFEAWLPETGTKPN